MLQNRSFSHENFVSVIIVLDLIERWMFVGWYLIYILIYKYSLYVELKLK